MNSKYILAICTLLLMSNCSINKKQVTDRKDYDNYLELAEYEISQNAEKELQFWTQKYEKQPSQFPYLSKIAASYSHLFAKTGKIEYLKLAEEELLNLNEITNYSSPGSLMSLSANYISQHKFKESLELLTKAELIGDHLSDIQKMLFDVHLELGNYDLARAYLLKIKNNNDFDYLIRLSKWSDHRGNLDAAIKYLEKAKGIAESSNMKGIKQWTYTNLADYYGHAGNIQASYTHFLKALELDPNDAYAKKGIAWIVYSHEKNPEEALRILNMVTQTYHAPDYYLLKADIYQFKGDIDAKDEQLKLYEVAVQNVAYGDMYNKYNVLLYAEENLRLDEAIAIAKIEVEHRPTPQSYELLAWAYYNKGLVSQALAIVDTYIVGHTYEPKALYHSAEIYQAAGKTEKAKALKKELVESSYELGPLIAERVNNL